MTAPRQNIFSLARDLDRTLLIVDHTDVYSSRLVGLTNFITRGSVYFVADALRLFHISLTVRQAKALELCKPLDSVRENQPLIIQPDPLQYGIASWYGPRFHGRMAASGEIYNMYDRTAAHKTIPLQSIVRVISQRTGKSVVVRINDRGPYVGGRTIDLSYGSKVALGMDDLASIYLERIDPTALDISCE
jgi:rare lipoprotein A